MSVVFSFLRRPSDMLQAIQESLGMPWEATRHGDVSMDTITHVVIPPRALRSATCAIDGFRTSWAVRQSPFEPHDRGLSSGAGCAVSIPADPEKNLGVAHALRQRSIDCGRAGGCANHRSMRNHKGYPTVVAASNASPALRRKKLANRNFFSIAERSADGVKPETSLLADSETAER